VRENRDGGPLCGIQRAEAGRREVIADEQSNSVLIGHFSR